MDVLVLDRGFQPVARVSWQRAVTLLWEGKVEVLDSYEKSVRSVTLELKVPAVIRHLRTVRAKKKGIRFSRENVYARDGGRCQYCSVKVARDEFTYDHVVPRKQGGVTSWDNVVVACVRCNQKKGGRTPAEAGMALRCKPCKPNKPMGTLRFPLSYGQGIPAIWKAWLRDVAYWHAELDE